MSHTLDKLRVLHPHLLGLSFPTALLPNEVLVAPLDLLESRSPPGELTGIYVQRRILSE
jgi:hypothetical protein